MCSVINHQNTQLDILSQVLIVILTVFSVTKELVCQKVLKNQNDSLYIKKMRPYNNTEIIVVVKMKIFIWNFLIFFLILLKT